MTIEEIVKNLRQEQRKRFGEMEEKTDCQNHCYIGTKRACRTCVPVFDSRGMEIGLQCEHGVCYFYNPKE